LNEPFAGFSVVSIGQIAQPWQAVWAKAAPSLGERGVIAS
jgi:hypothetical protein